MPPHHHKDYVPPHHGAAHTTNVAEAGIAANHQDSDDRLVPTEDIRLCAYRKWEGAGKPSGDGIAFWLEAEQELVHAK